MRYWCLAAVFALLGSADRSSALDVPPTDPERAESSVTARSLAPAPEGTSSPAEVPSSDHTKPQPAAPDAVSATPKVETGPARSEVPALRAAANARLAKLPQADDKAATQTTKALRDVYEIRFRWLDEWEKAVKERIAAENPKPTPEDEAAEWKADLARIKDLLEQSAKDPAVLYPAPFRLLPAQVPDSRRAAMKDAIDAAQTDLNDRTSKLEQCRAETTQKDAAALATIRARRDKAHQRVATLKARNPEGEAPLDDAKNPDARELARELAVNLEWESRVEVERLKGLEALVEVEGRRAELAPMHLQLLEALVHLSRQTLDGMKACYGAMADKQERDLHQAAQKEQTRAEEAEDPIERYKAKRTAALLELQARVVTSENTLATNPSPSLEEQRALADRAETDFTKITHLLDDGRVSHLDSLRFNNDFRRLGAERSRIVRNEQAISSNRLATAENALTGIELELIYDARDDRYELENLLERLPKSRHAAAIAIYEDQERKQTALLKRRRDALEKIAQRAEQTHEQVLRRLRIVDDHLSFIRTNLFWVRDEEPVGLQSLAEVKRELTQVGRLGVRFVAELFDRSAWGRVSVEFLLAIAALALTPWPLSRLYRVLRRLRDPVHRSTARAV
jgi:potassium efflux system protein